MYQLASQNKELYSKFLSNKENIALMQLLEQENHIKNIEDLVLK